MVKRRYSRYPSGLTRIPTPPPLDHSFNKPDDPEPLRIELARLRHEEWKRTSVCDGRGAAEAACVKMALLRGYEAAESEVD